MVLNYSAVFISHLKVSQEHGRPDNVVRIVGPIELIEGILRVDLLGEVAGHHCPHVGLHALFVVPDFHVDVGRHVRQVACALDVVEQAVCQHQCVEVVGRQVQQVDVQVADLRVVGVVYRLPQQLLCQSALGCWLALLRPQLPGLGVHQGLHVQ